MYHGRPLYRVGKLRDGTQPHIREIKEILGMIFEVSLEHDLSNPARKRTLPVNGPKWEKIRSWKNTAHSVVYDRFSRMGEKVAWSEFSQLGLSNQTERLVWRNRSVECYLLFILEGREGHWKLRIVTGIVEELQNVGWKSRKHRVLKRKKDEEQETGRAFCLPCERIIAYHDFVAADSASLPFPFLLLLSGY